jgi:hypothetical protein
MNGEKIAMRKKEKWGEVNEMKYGNLDRGGVMSGF